MLVLNRNFENFPLFIYYFCLIRILFCRLYIDGFEIVKGVVGE